MPLALVVFDCDGVLLESVEAKTRAFERIEADFGPRAAGRLTRHHKENGGVSRAEKFAWFFKEVLYRPLSAGENEALCRRFASFCLEEVLSSSLVPGALETLTAWSGRVPLFVASGTPQEELAEVLRHKGLAGYFTGIFGSPPDKASLLRNILRLSGAPPEQAVMVGDSRTDQLAAEAAGALFYGRGQCFRSSGHPWHHDLTRLNLYLEKLAEKNL
ncbi:MAG: HAD family hydrolase [Desulfovibrio sp.]|jgi:phosphoglycolate phosphatase-like HAD superfamily hydrolase|nr:HAD family hydrolase [Desulfovibrio sp.]